MAFSNDMSTVISEELNGVEQHTPHHRRKDFYRMPVESFEVALSRLTISTPRPITTEMMDNSTISTPSGPVSAHQERSEPKQELCEVVPPGFNYLPTTSDMSCLDSSVYTCGLCGHRPPHRQLMTLHSRSHLILNRRRLRRAMYTKLDPISQMVALSRGGHVVKPEQTCWTKNEDQIQLLYQQRTLGSIDQRN